MEARDEEDRLERERREKRREIRRQAAKQREIEEELSGGVEKSEDVESGKRGTGGLLRSSLEEDELRGLAMGRMGLLAPAWRLWKWRQSCADHDRGDE